MRLSWILVGMLVLAGCGDRAARDAAPAMSKVAPEMPIEQEATFLALGDSYTIGESVGEADRWPMQLVDLLRRDDRRIGEPRIVARTGWTTAELSAGMDQLEVDDTYDLVSLLIGVNNQYRGLSADEYRTEFRELVATAIRFAAGTPSHVVVLSIPDWGVTPFAADRDRGVIASEIDAFNRINHEESAAAGVHYVDVTAISRQVPDDATLVAGDGLHPSAAMYARWAEAVLPVAQKILE